MNININVIIMSSIVVSSDGGGTVTAGPAGSELGASASLGPPARQRTPVQEAVERLGQLDEYVKATRAAAAKKDDEETADMLVTVTDIKLIAGLLMVLKDAAKHDIPSQQ